MKRKTEGKGIKEFTQDHTRFRDMIELVGLKFSTGIWHRAVSESVKTAAPLVSDAP